MRTPTGTITVGGGGKPPANCCKGGIVEQYSMGLFGLGCLPYNHLSNTSNIDGSFNRPANTFRTNPTEYPIKWTGKMYGYYCAVQSGSPDVISVGE